MNVESWEMSRMILSLAQPAVSPTEQRLLLPGCYDWPALQALQALLEQSPGLRITYLDGWIELMTLGESHELIKSLLGMFLEAYLIAQEIEFIPVGSATRRGEAEGVSFEPDESYYLGARKEHPDLAIEVILTSGTLQKLEKYRRFGIPEVWFWENNQITVHTLEQGLYQNVPRSVVLPQLDLALLARCVQMPSRLEAMKTFMDAL
jgi:Uma2 family endonuclease